MWTCEHWTRWFLRTLPICQAVTLCTTTVSQICFHLRQGTISELPVSPLLHVMLATKGVKIIVKEDKTLGTQTPWKSHMIKYRNVGFLGKAGSDQWGYFSLSSRLDNTRGLYGNCTRDILEAPSVCSAMYMKKTSVRNGFPKWQNIVKTRPLALGVNWLSSYQTPSLMPLSGRLKLAMEVSISLLLTVPKSCKNYCWTRSSCSQGWDLRLTYYFPPFLLNAIRHIIFFPLSYVVMQTCNLLLLWFTEQEYDKIRSKGLTFLIRV